jgi:hypothetical protein
MANTILANGSDKPFELSRYTDLHYTYTVKRGEFMSPQLIENLRK